MINVLHSRAELAALPATGGQTAVVMTMGALHRGHAALIEQARALVGSAGRVIVTDFVNPRQFGAGEDFDAYPRTLDDDVEIAEAAGADVVWAPAIGEVYAASGAGAGITIDPGPLGAELEGVSRPGHFAGMLTVVAKLLVLTRADIALFGEKDYQQLTLIRAMVAALDLPVDVVAVSTVRDADGLALSSRNRYLDDTARQLAARIPRAIDAASAAAARGGQAAVAAARDVLSDPAIDLDYVEVRDVDLGPAPGSGEARLLIAVCIDGTRLIDNASIVLGGGS